MLWTRSPSWKPSAGSSTCTGDPGGLIHCSQLLLFRNGLAASVTTSCAANQLTAYDEVLGAIALSAALKDPSNG